MKPRADAVQRRQLLRAASAGAAAVGLGVFTGAAQAAVGLERVKARGALSVGLYNDLPPFHVAGQGIEVELGEALAKALGVRYSPLPFPADENMNDDLRNMVWRGHYLGYGPSDVLLHVPVDRPLIEATPQAMIFGPYWRERVMIARNLEALPALDAFESIGKRPVAVPGQSLAGWLLLGAEGGALRDQLQTKWKDGVEAAQALKRGDVPVAAGLQSELEHVLRGDTRFAISPLPSPRAPRDGWAVGMAVKKDARDLAEALQAALNGLASGGQLAAMFQRANLGWKPV